MEKTIKEIIRSTFYDQWELQKKKPHLVRCVLGLIKNALTNGKTDHKFNRTAHTFTKTDHLSY